METEHGSETESKRMPSSLWRYISRARPDLVLLVIYLLLLCLINWLWVEQRVILYLFYLPVIFAAWFMPKRQAVGVAILAAMMVVAYAFFIPGRLTAPTRDALVWADLTIWGGILVVTAYIVSTLRFRAERALRDLQRAYSGVLSILSKFISIIDADTEAHSVRVSAWAVRLAQALGLNRSSVEEARLVGLLHDVGKVDISVELIRKAATLSQEEQTAIKAHAAQGAAMIKPMGGILAKIANAIEAHHEKMDGSGYRGLKGEEIPLLARIVAVADALDAMLSDRPYRKGTGLSQALDGIVAGSGTHFDPKVVAALKKIVHEDGEQAVVMPPLVDSRIK